MKLLCCILALFSASTVFASAEMFDLKMELYIDGKEISKPRIIATADHKASVSQAIEGKDETFIEVVASNDSERVKDGILMKFAVGYIRKGKREVISNPQILTNEGQRAEIVVADDKLKEKLRLNVLVSRLKR